MAPCTGRRYPARAPHLTELTPLRQLAQLLAGGVFAIGDDPTHAEVGPEAHAVEPVEPRLLVLHIRWRDQRRQDDAGLPTIDNITRVIVIAERRRAARAHRRRVRVGRAVLTVMSVMR